MPVTVELELEATSWTFERGHRVRLALAGADWPNTWPPPVAGVLAVDRATVELELPVLVGCVPHAAADASRRRPAETRTHPRATSPSRRHVDDRARRARPAGHARRSPTAASTTAPFGAHVEEEYDGEVGVSTADPAAAWARALSRYRVTWPEADVVTEARLEVRSDADAYHVTSTSSSRRSATPASAGASGASSA